MPSEMELTLHSDAVQGTVNLVNGEEYNGYMFYKVENGWKRYSRAYAQTKLNKKQMPEIEEALEKAGVSFLPCIVIVEHANHASQTLIESGDDNGRPVRQYWIIAQGTIEQGQAILD